MEIEDKRTLREVIVPVPEIWGEKYTAQDKTDVIEIITWLNGANGRAKGQETRRDRAMLARAANINATTMHEVLKGAYVSPPEKHIKKALGAVRRDSERVNLNTRVRLEFVETSVTKTVFSVCHRVNLYKDMGVIAGNPGTGKSEGIKHYCSTNPQAILIEATMNMNAGMLLDLLVETTDAEVRASRTDSRGTQAQKLLAVISKLKGQDRVIVIDEADLMVPATLETLRRINDLAEVGIVLSGEPKLRAMITKKHGRFERIASRVGFWVPVIKHIQEADCRALITATLTSEVISDEIHDAFWQTCEGSARTLSKLLPNVRDFGLAQGGTLTPALIFEVAQKTLSYERKSRATV